jgi:hypothetical protein
VEWHSRNSGLSVVYGLVATAIQHAQYPPDGRLCEQLIDASAMLAGGRDGLRLSASGLKPKVILLTLNIFRY